MGPHSNGTAARKRLRVERKGADENANSATMRLEETESRMPANYFHRICISRMKLVIIRFEFEVLITHPR